MSGFCAIVTAADVYYEGDSLDGHVFVNVANEHIKGTSIDIALVGVACTNVRHRDDMKTLHEVRARLVLEHTIPTQSSESPSCFLFSIPIAEYSQPRSADKPDFNEKRFLDDDGAPISEKMDAKLPPSWGLRMNQRQGMVSVSIIYELIARVESPIFGDHEAKKVVKIQRRPTLAGDVWLDYVPISRSAFMRSDELLPENESISKGGFRNLFKSVRKAELSLKITAHIPAHAYLDQPLQLAFEMSPSTKDPDVIEPPEILLESLFAILKQNASVRSDQSNVSLGRLGSASCTRDMSGVLFNKNELTLDEQYSGRVLKLEPENDFTQTVTTRTLKLSELVPTFITSNIACTYTLGLVVVFRCAGIHTTFKSKTRIILLPPVVSTVVDPSSSDPPPFTADPRFSSPTNAKSPTTKPAAKHDLPQSAVDEYFSIVEDDAFDLIAKMRESFEAWTLYVDWSFKRLQSGAEERRSGGLPPIAREWNTAARAGWGDGGSAAAGAVSGGGGGGGGS